LEELSFDDTFHHHCFNQEDFWLQGVVLPAFPKLKILQVYCEDLFLVGRYLTSKNHPKLENFNVGVAEGSFNKDLTLTLILNNWKYLPLNSVKILKLKLNNVMTLEEIQRAQFKFPNVKSVSIDGQFSSSKLISALCINFKFLEELDVEILAVDLRQKLVSLLNEMIYIEGILF
jgi:hypothetical protein